MMKTLFTLTLLLIASTTAFSPPRAANGRSFPKTQLSSSRSTNESPIVNCHVHLFTKDAVPPDWPNKWLSQIARWKLTRWFAVHVVPHLVPFPDSDLFERYANLLKHGTMDSQEKNFVELDKRYKCHPNTKFVVLPMDLRALDQGNPPKQSITEQHEKLAGVEKKHRDRGKVIPFVHIDPRFTDDSGHDAVTFIRNLHQTGLNGTKFHGIKLHPPLGYHPDDECMEPIFEYANTHKLPIITHCMSRGGIWNTKQESMATLKEFTAPSSYVRVLRKHPDMRLCLAHFGGNVEWDKYSRRRHPPSNTETMPLSYFESVVFKKLDWVSQIVMMLQSGLFPNLYVDTAYTFSSKKYLPRLKKLMETWRTLASRTVFSLVPTIT